MPNDDYIKKADAVFAVQNRIEQIGMENNPYVCSIRQAVRDVPAADVEPVRHGRWVGMAVYCQHLFDTTGERYTMSQLGISHPHCNKCWNENESRTAFCPHCGAKMDEKEDSDAEVH